MTASFSHIPPHRIVQSITIGAVTIPMRIVSAASERPEHWSLEFEPSSAAPSVRVENLNTGYISGPALSKPVSCVMADGSIFVERTPPMQVWNGATILVSVTGGNQLRCQFDIAWETNAHTHKARLSP